jgi:hypothetical protein
MEVVTLSVIWQSLEWSADVDKRPNLSVADGLSHFRASMRKCAVKPFED